MAYSFGKNEENNNSPCSDMLFRDLQLHACQIKPKSEWGSD
jgi:hypothetical protein